MPILPSESSGVESISEPAKVQAPARRKPAGFGKMPHAIASDERLSAMDVRVALALLSHTRGDCCYPSNGELGRYARASADTVQRSLRALEQAGYIRCDRSKPTPRNATGRTIVLLWREGEATAPMRGGYRTHAVGVPHPCGGGTAPMPPKEDRSRKKKEEERSGPAPLPQRQRPGPPAPYDNLLPPGRPKTYRRRGDTPARPTLPPGPDDSRPVADCVGAVMDRLRHRAPVATPEPSEPPQPPRGEPASPAASSMSSEPAEPVSGVLEPSELVGGGAGAEPSEPLAIPDGLTLTDAERSALRDRDARGRALILQLLASDDPVLMREGRAKLRPRPTGPAPTHALATADLLLGIRDDPSYPIVASDRLAREFGDAKSRRGFEARCRAAYEGRLDPAALVDAYRQATGPKARNPGAIFMHACSRC